MRASWDVGHGRRQRFARCASAAALSVRETLSKVQHAVARRRCRTHSCQWLCCARLASSSSRTLSCIEPGDATRHRTDRSSCSSAAQKKGRAVVPIACMKYTPSTRLARRGRPARQSTTTVRSKHDLNHHHHLLLLLLLRLHRLVDSSTTRACSTTGFLPVSVYPPPTSSSSLLSSTAAV
jgi:hypothetical protein